MSEENCPLTHVRGYKAAVGRRKRLPHVAAQGLCKYVGRALSPANRFFLRPLPYVRGYNSASLMIDRCACSPAREQGDQQPVTLATDIASVQTACYPNVGSAFHNGAAVGKDRQQIGRRFKSQREFVGAHRAERGQPRG
jgi:hypothetical protein